MSPKATCPPNSFLHGPCQDVYRIKDTTMTDLKIEAGKCYRTRDGHKAHVVYRLDDELLGGLVQVPCNQTPVVQLWDENGGCGPAEYYRHDLISEWKEPRKGEVWVNIYESDRGIVFTGRSACHSRESADWQHKYRADGGGGKRIAVASGPWTEGQGLTGEGSE